jgi:ubiquinone/menaquinone biosynthesis C-methylase UbiE
MQNDNHRFIEVKLSKEDVRRIYARVSGIYDFWSFLTESKAVGQAVQMANIKNGETILEVAVGTGYLFERIVSKNQAGRNDGIDLSPEMLEKAKKRLDPKRFHNYSLKVADAYSLPYPDLTFNLIMNSYMFDLLPEEDFPRVLNEFQRVLKPGGRMVITSMTHGRKWYSRFWDWLLHKAPGILEGCRPISLEDDINRSGFINIHAEYVSQFTFPSLIVYAEKPDLTLQV